jgi:hypothetical protein
VKVANGNLQVAVQGTVPVSVQGTVSADVGTVDVGTVAAISGTVNTKPPVWTVGDNRGEPVTDEATPIAASASGRVYIRFTNNGPDNVFIYPDESVTTNDMLIEPGQSREFHGGHAGGWYGITDTGLSAVVSCIEFVCNP